MVLEEESYGKTDILHAVQVTYQKKQSRDRLKIRNHQTASEEALFPLCFMKSEKNCQYRLNFQAISCYYSDFPATGKPAWNEEYMSQYPWRRK